MDTKEQAYNKAITNRDKLHDEDCYTRKIRDTGSKYTMDWNDGYGVFLTDEFEYERTH